ncbi:MAG: hypothetical protein OXC30_03340 [Alphaproteobacteria bacterium]|nr:hypothetical protein [Alphaproteobacteria bacterium]
MFKLLLLLLSINLYASKSVCVLEERNQCCVINEDFGSVLAGRVVTIKGKECIELQDGSIIYNSMLLQLKKCNSQSELLWFQENVVTKKPIDRYVKVQIRQSKNLSGKNSEGNSSSISIPLLPTGVAQISFANDKELRQIERALQSQKKSDVCRGMAFPKKHLKKQNGQTYVELADAAFERKSKNTACCIIL